MQQKYDSSIKLNSFGTPDVDFYISEAKRLRVETFLTLVHGAAEWLRKTVDKFQGLPMRTIH